MMPVWYIVGIRGDISLNRQVVKHPDYFVGEYDHNRIEVPTPTER